MNPSRCQGTTAQQRVPFRLRQPQVADFHYQFERTGGFNGRGPDLMVGRPTFGAGWFETMFSARNRRSRSHDVGSVTAQRALPTLPASTTHARRRALMAATPSRSQYTTRRTTACPTFSSR